MFYNTIPLIIAGLSLGGIIFIIARKLPVLTALDTDSIPQVKEATVKKNLLDERLRRKLREFFAKLNPAVKFLSNKGGTAFKRLYQRAMELERKYQRQSPAVLTGGEEEQAERIKEFLDQAEELLEAEKYLEAEQKYIEIIALDNKNIEAYKGLGELYLEQKNYDQAKETMEFILKLNKDDARTYNRLGAITSQKGNLEEAKEYYLKSLALSSESAAAHVDLGLVCQATGDQEEAFKCLQKAAAIEPNNPRYLDLLLEMAIILGRKGLAEETFKKLKEVNPENQKLNDLKKEIRQMR
ncbi:MAG: tetratricopeptide repeat protein [bacterium]